MLKALTTRRRIVPMLAAGTAALLASALLAPAAHATSAWYLGYDNGSVASTGDEIVNDGTASVIFSGLYNGNNAMVTCNIPQGEITYTVPATVPSAAPGQPISVQLTPPHYLNSGECTENVTTGGGAVNVTMDTSKTWTLTVTAPSGSGPTGPYSGTLSGTLTVPQDGIQTVEAVDLIGIPPNDCVISGPQGSDLTIGGSYDTSTGTAANTTNPTFNVDNDACPEVNNDPTMGDLPTLNTASVTLRLADSSGNPTSSIPTAVWQ